MYDRDVNSQGWFANYIDTCNERDVRELTGIRDANTLDTHTSRRSLLFEPFVIDELVKQRCNQGQASDLYFWRDRTCHEVAVLRDTPKGLQAIKIKSGRTFASDWPKGLHQWEYLAGAGRPASQIIFGGDAGCHREDYELLS